jgi:hypothetical protein
MLLTFELGPDGDVEFTQIADFVTVDRTVCGGVPAGHRPLRESIPTEKFSEASALLQSPCPPQRPDPIFLSNSGIRLLTSLQAPTLW